MQLSELKQKALKELSKDGLKERLSDKTISSKWLKRRKIAMYGFIVSSIVVSSSFPITLPVAVVQIAELIQLTSILLGGRAQLNKSK